MLLLRYAVWLLFRSLAWLRYRVRVQGWEKVRGRPGPFLIVPSHPAYIDPLLVLAVTWPALRPRPMLYESNFRGILLRPLMFLLDAIRVPDTDQVSAAVREQTQRAVQEAVEALRQGRSVAMWPAGHVQRDGLEHLGSASGLVEILQNVEQVTLVRIRTRGLFGSMLSYAMTSKAPRLGERARAALGWLAASLLVFMPRRRVEMTVDVVEKGQLPELRRETINPWLEEWYNAPGAEEPTFVPYHLFLGPRTYDYPPPAQLESVDPSRIRPQTREAVNHVILDRLREVGHPASEADLQADTLLDRLGLDSMARMDLTLAVERRFGFTAADMPLTVGHLWALAEGLVHKAPPRPAPPAWFQPASGQDRVEIVGDTLGQAFVERALRSRQRVALADDLAGVLVYERLLVGALTLARRLARLEKRHVGLLLPASVGCDLALLALQLAGKVPVLLNWTTGSANLAHAVRLTGLDHVVTSAAFVQRAGIVVPGVSALYLEDLGREVGKLRQLLTLLRVRWLPGGIRRSVPNVDPDEPAVILFTSGSEKAPKAVPLTHRNLLSNQRACLEVLRVSSSDSVLGFLPAFHSFGLSVTGLVPILCGVRMVHHADPTDAGGLARKIASYRPTILAGTPSFFSYILDRARPGDLDSLRIILVGAEKCLPRVFDRCRELAPGAELLEGYGITECAPVVSVNPPGQGRPGSIGRPLPGVRVKVVDLSLENELAAGAMGMLLVAGPNIFPGYLGHEGDPPFVEREGQRWYVTGDLVRVDEGYLYFEGRLKRFLKAGGEMISLPALEEPFARLYPPTQEGPQVAVEGIETDDGRHIVLFTTRSVSLHEANGVLTREGFHGVMRLTDVRRVDAIPVLGTGKTDYKVLRAQLQKESE